jgi:hypothetical protein
MNLTELLDSIRDHYLERLTAAIDEKVDAGVTVATEVALRDETGAPKGDGVFDLPMRVDLAVLTGGTVSDSITVDTETMLSFDEVVFDWDGLGVTLSPFQWNWCEVLAEGTFTEASVEPLIDWFHEWFVDGEDGDGTELLGAVHYMSDPQLTASQISFVIDLGTAPVDAFEELLDAVAATGATSVNLGEDDDEDAWVR